MIEFLETEGLVTRDKRGEIDVPDWVALLRRWSDDYGFVRNSNVTRWIAVRGLANLLSRVAESSVQYAVTGTLAAENWAPYAPARSAMIYVAHADHAAEQWNLREADAGANVMLAEPESDIVFARAKATRANVAIAAPSQVVVDLMTGPGRSPSEAEELIEWMVRNESSWRR
ncbi:type IV toxin-antitoxin system AbiEi family antitoxin [Actinomadura formosensis]|uniref:type IV toxin-antitoxin system AbiEi family antitoxin n=1 Tax=Actinomadura formosensis TaxID=60706 RepID=UPI003D90DEA4